MSSLAFFHIRCIVVLIRCTTICSFNCEEHDNLYGFFIKAMIKYITNISYLEL